MKSRSLTHALVYKLAVIRAPLEVAVTDSVASVGGNAALRCLVPPAAREHVSLTTWVSDDDVNVFPFTDIAANRSRFQAFPSGLLLVTGVTRADERRRFRCVVKDSLTGEKVDSAVWGKLIVTVGSSTDTGGIKACVSVALVLLLNKCVE
ncbi:hypothetical protein HPB47_007923 [Ixodes persulcatus]|uniref:Uncharacterized protein n=1 Tax=Ixodes persulcatus TaxID=34615 RepID=A0AC60P6B8_IXOPE|nr:hypothetical protein HPB47_007923 [Ixodes persulcatus]